jgi:hypothetical protein
MNARELVRPVATLLVSMAAVALIAGVTGYALTARHLIVPNEWVLLRIPHAKQAAFIGDLWAHSASYLSGFVGAIVLCAYVWRSRTAVGNR